MTSNKILEVKKTILDIEKNESKSLQKEIEQKMATLEKKLKRLNQTILVAYDVLN